MCRCRRQHRRVYRYVLLGYGAGHVYAVDVGHGQLAEKLARGRRVTNLEKTHARELDAALIPQQIDLQWYAISLLFRLPRRWPRH